MLRTFLGAKLHRMKVTEANLNYVGSITIDSELLSLSGIMPGERVLVACVNTGARFETYVVEGLAGSGVICINGAAARLCAPGDLVIILQYVLVDTAKEKPPVPVVVVADRDNLSPAVI
jgi:aspartate 1-decarboxylase